MDVPTEPQSTVWWAAVAAAFAWFLLRAVGLRIDKGRTVELSEADRKTLDNLEKEVGQLRERVGIVETRVEERTGKNNNNNTFREEWPGYGPSEA